MVTPTVMPRCTPSATASWPRLAWATWAAYSRRAMSATRGIDSRDLLRQVVARVNAAGIRPMSLDLTITAARPRLGGARLDRMRVILAGLLGLDPDAIAVQASTGNLSGDEGAGRTISASALVGVWTA